MLVINMEWGIKMNTSDWINVIGIIVSIVEIVLWVIDYFRGVIKKKRDDLEITTTTTTTTRAPSYDS